jgi:hypothetical protein
MRQDPGQHPSGCCGDGSGRMSLLHRPSWSMPSCRDARRRHTGQVGEGDSQAYLGGPSLRAASGTTAVTVQVIDVEFPSPLAPARVPQVGTEAWTVD